MTKKIKFYNLEIKGIENLETENKNIIYYSYELGEGCFYVNKEHENISKLITGQNYIGEFIVSDKKDFVRDEKNGGYNSEVNSELERIVDEHGNIFYNKKE